MTATANFVGPKWSDFSEREGLDPLGMQTSCVGLYQQLVPGISNVTQRVRYYGFYPWIASEYARRSGDTNPSTWKRFLRRAEALYALIAANNDDEYGVGGLRWAQNFLKSARTSSLKFSPDPKGSPKHLQQAFGVYGAAYGSQLFEMGILQDSDHRVPTHSETLGANLADIWTDQFREMADRFIESLEKGEVTTTDLNAMKGMAPSRIRKRSRESRLYEQLLFADKGLDRDGDHARKRSLLLVLHVAALLKKAPTPDHVRWALYSLHSPIDSKPLALPEELRETRQRWWVYHANDLTHACYETLLKFTLDHLKAKPAGVPLGTLIAELVAALLEENAGASSWEKYVSAIKLTPNAGSLRDHNSEASLLSDPLRNAQPTSVASAAIAWKALRLLATLHARARDCRDWIEAALKPFNGQQFRSIHSELQFLDRHAKEPMADFLGHLIEERVFHRHIMVAMRKLQYQGDYTFLIETDNGLVRFRGPAGPTLTNPRLQTSLNFLRDIHLLTEDGPSPEGASRIAAA